MSTDCDKPPRAHYISELQMWFIDFEFFWCQIAIAALLRVVQIAEQSLGFCNRPDMFNVDDYEL
jgi:hypothetical protein